ncbi:tRNA adenosine(34) deaminase TadA [Enterococcus villorum]|uniref:tRNA-specific adenosine deaminase n=2 Tax=Enterococcus villorum TaxID=112904 RepID=A0A511J468_9ENTE|nr:tRNA adenosine(34) deaminase TadA [Enterococcus villorum]EOH92354.1 cytidine/deoxycytidylate deaminase [Enterococcus villorum ATCC 700913]EOW75723.1 cytidine/deoxycytidylate deaminase [Enterococcus villorum ATCC 700913]GEL92808.1 tRNA-specific adenosine deaminase [Enterococcus villorum]
MESKELENQKHEKWMRLALEEAKKAEKIAEVPIGAIVVLNGEVIGKGYNLRETTQDATTHAEMIAIREACQTVGSWRLEEAQLYVTLEPCPMCSGAMILSRVKEVYFGAFDQKGGTAGTLMNLLEDQRFNHQTHVIGGILEAECGQILSAFFKELRTRKKKLKKG